MHQLRQNIIPTWSFLSNQILSLAVYNVSCFKCYFHEFVSHQKRVSNCYILQVLNLILYKRSTLTNDAESLHCLFNENSLNNYESEFSPGQ